MKTKINISFVDADDIRCNIEVEATPSKASSAEGSYTVHFRGEGGNGCGQIYDTIQPVTEPQKRLLDLWKQHRLTTLSYEDCEKLMGEIDILADMIKCQVKPEYHPANSVIDVNSMPRSYDEDDIKKVCDKCGIRRRMAVVSLALANYTCLTVEEVADKIGAGIHRDCTYDFEGVTYYIGGEGELKRCARKYLTENTEFWKGAVEADRTTKGLVAWAIEAVETDGWASVLNGWDDTYSECFVGDGMICVTRA